MSTRIWKGFGLTLIWAHALVLSSALIIFARYQPIPALHDDADTSALDKLTGYGVMFAAADVAQSEAALEEKLDGNKPGGGGDASKQFSAMFGSMDALDAAQELYTAPRPRLPGLAAAARIPLSVLLVWAAAAIVLLCVGVSIPGRAWARLYGLARRRRAGPAHARISDAAGRRLA
jgi:hypothetical protein